MTPRGREAIEPALATIPGSDVVDDAERRRLRIPTDRRWGDRMLAAEPGVLFWPDYFHVRDSKILGMHGYLDKRDETHGLMVVASTRVPTPPHRLGLRPLVDVFATLCDLVGVPVPRGQEGTSLLANGRARRSGEPLERPIARTDRGRSATTRRRGR